MLEFYQAYADYQDLMDFSERMLRYVVERATGALQFDYQDDRYDFSSPFRRLTMMESILAHNKALQPGDLADLTRCRNVAKNLEVEVKDHYGLGKLELEIFESTVEQRLQQPTFITAYPTEVSPLARRNDQDPLVTDRFELFIAGREIANGFSELNDPGRSGRALPGTGGRKTGW